MKSRLDSVLEGLHPSRTIQDISRRVDEAINSFYVEYDVTHKWHMFETMMVNFIRHLQSHIFDVESMPETHSGLYWGQCLDIFKKLYGQNGEKTAFDIVRSNSEGGIRKVLDNFAREVAKHYAQNEINAKVWFFWNNLSNDERFAVIQEYIEKYSHLIPEELRDGFPGRIYANMPTLLLKHPYIIDAMNRGHRNRKQ